MFKNLPITFLLGSLLSLAYSNSIQNEDIVYFPNPNGDGSLIPGKLSPDPSTVLGDESDIHFYLYTRRDANKQEELIVGDRDSVTRSNFINGAQTKLLIHGFGGHYTHTFPWALSREYMKLSQDINIILVEWSILADNSNYFGAVANAQLVSRKSADLLEFLIGQGFIPRSNVHIVGFSLGGQIAGQIGSRVTQKLPRITALDPALPLFDVADLHNRTDPSDADLVEVMHTAGVILGYWEACGTIDWYPNGGRAQPGCGTDLTGSCAHNRAPAMYVESLFTPIGFWGRECPDYDSYNQGLCNNNRWELMGHHTPTNATGIYFLTTNAQAPFARG